MSRKLTIALGIGVMLTVAACSSSGGGKQPAPAPPTLWGSKSLHDPGFPASWA
jgi:hypothetical protein